MLTCFLTRKHMKIVNPPLFRPSERLRGDRNFVPKNRGRNSTPPPYVVKAGYLDLFSVRRHVKINNPTLLRPSKRLRGDQNFMPKNKRRNSTPSEKLVLLNYPWHSATLLLLHHPSATPPSPRSRPSFHLS